MFFDRWPSSYATISGAFTDVKQDMPTWKWHHRLWVYEYQLYGDPRYGQPEYSGGSKASTPVRRAEIEGPVSSLDVVVPDYIVTTIGGEDDVEIPGGAVLSEDGQPVIPYYTTSVDYPAGYKIQDVTLSDRSGLVTTSGLNIPPFEDDWDCAGGEEASVTSQATFSPESLAAKSGSASEGEGWWPEDVFTWTVSENADGTTLDIVMYPFYYNPPTTDVKFYKNYSFDIDYIVSPVAITDLSTDKDEYQQGETVLVDIQLNNSAVPQDVVVSAVVEESASGEIVDGLLLSTLEAFTGPASFSPQWESSGFEPGYYSVEVTLEDTAGNVLDRQTEMFRLGIYSGEVTAFTAAPEYFEMGDDIEIDMTFSNTGTVNISGSAVIRILNPSGDLVDEFVHDVTDLMPSESISFDDMWHATEAEKGSYSVVGYVSYDSQATEPAVVTLRTVCGDVDCDGDVDAVDALFILQYVVGLRSPSDQCPPPEGHLYLPGADVDCDDDVDAVDALFALQHVVGLRPELCVCPEP